jgi:hypothetical protein
LRKKKQKTVYYEDKGQTIYSMAALNGRTPEEQEEYDKRRKNADYFTAKERWTMIRAAFSVYGPLLLIVVGAFLVTGILLYFFLI